MGFTDSVFGGKDETGFLTPPQSEEAIFAREELKKISQDLPDIPLREIAALPELGEERTVAREKALELAQGQDIFSLPEVQGIINETIQKGDLLANRLGRAMQASGNFSTTTGRDVLGRAVTDVQKSLASSLGTFASQERGRQAGAIPLLEQLGLQRQGEVLGTEQAGLDAAFNKAVTESNQIQNFLVPLLQSFITQQPSSRAQLATEQGDMGLIETVQQGGAFLGDLGKIFGFGA